jgi:hypothetical protein
MMNQPTLHELDNFIGSPTVENASALVGVPSLYHVLKLYWRAGFPERIINVCGWLHERGMEVMAELTKCNPEVPGRENVIHELDWRQEGIFQRMSRFPTDRIVDRVLL